MTSCNKSFPNGPISEDEELTCELKIAHEGPCRATWVSDDGSAFQLEWLDGASWHVPHPRGYSDNVTPDELHIFRRDTSEGNLFEIRAKGRILADADDAPTAEFVKTYIANSTLANGLPTSTTRQALLHRLQNLRLQTAVNLYW